MAAAKAWPSPAQSVVRAMAALSSWLHQGERNMKARDTTASAVDVSRAAASHIELVWEPTCPHVEAARDVLRAALAAVGLPATWTEWRIGGGDLPEHARGFGSPTILINGVDVIGQTASESDACCRVYPGPKGLAGVPDVEVVVSGLRAAALKPR